MEKKLLISLIFLVLIPSVNACTTPWIYNEYGVPINIYGGYLIIEGKNYPSSQPTILYNLTVNNTNNQILTLVLTPSDDFLGYFYGGTFEIGPKELKKISLKVYVDGQSKFGEMEVTGSCKDGFSIVEGSINVRIYGRGNTNPQFCKNTITSCGLWPNCFNLTGMRGCYDGYKREYYCAGNEIRYVASCTNACCQLYYGNEGYCSGNVCYGSTPVCEDECSFSGLECHDGDVYACELKGDGCYDLVLSKECGELICVDGKCVDESSIRGKIAYLCQDNTCNDGIEPRLISWLKTKGWKVDGKAYNVWTNEELENYDLMLCSDELRACKFSKGFVIYNEHKLHNKSLLEIPDYREAQAAYSLNYIKNPYGSIRESDGLYITENDDPIMRIFPTETAIFTATTKMTIIADYYLNPSVIDLADVGYNGIKSTLFKVKSDGSHGRYAYVGWFYRLSPYNLTDEGKELLDRMVLWVVCGDECFFNPNENQPPVAVAKITPNPVGYEGMLIKFDASESYDPEGRELKYYWDFGDGENSGWITDKATNHSYDSQGEYIVTLIVNDGELDSTPELKRLTILPTIKNKVAFICGGNSCSDETERELISFLNNNGFFVEGKAQSSWTKEDLNDFDMMMCSDAASGCGIRSWTAVYDKHMNGMMGFLEIPDYSYVRAGYKFGYTNTLTGYSNKGSSIKIIKEDAITSGLSGNIYNNEKIMGGIFNSSLKSFAVNLAKLNNRDVSVMFKVDAKDNHGRYAYVGWFYRSSTSDLTVDGKEMLLRTIRWVQCGSVEGCG
jgi:hypothetical protein